MKPAHRSNRFRQEKPHMLEIALAPAAIPFYVFRQIRRQSFVAAVEIDGEPNFPTGVLHKRCFHEIMAQNAATQRCPSREFR
jgi:hypothetical protein